MHLETLEVENLRILARVALNPGQRINALVGANGSGKTSLLEALYLLGSGRSFRSHRLADLVTHGQQWLRVRGDVRGGGGARSSVGLERGPEGVRIRASGELVRSASSLARRLPLVVITPDSQRLLTDGAVLRRQLIDWPLFHVEPSYLEVLQRYRRALRQRNMALRETAGSDGLAPWDRELGQAGEALHGLRERHLEEIIPVFGRVLERLLSVNVDVRYQPGWEIAAPLVEALAAGTWADRSRGFTGVGPHRADLRFSVSGVAAHRVLSRGEGKLFVVGLLLAQGEFLSHIQGRRPIVLVDDLASELDADNRRLFLAELEALEAQAFVTTVSKDLLEMADFSKVKVFHVKRGTAVEMV